MVQVTIDVPEDMKEDIVRALKIRKAISQSRMTDNDVEELSNKINEAIWKRHKYYEISGS